MGKAAIDCYTKWFAVEMANRYGDTIRINSIMPGFFLTAQNKNLLSIGGGLGGLELVINKKFNVKSFTFIERNYVSKKVKYGWDNKNNEAYNDIGIQKNFLTKKDEVHIRFGTGEIKSHMYRDEICMGHDDNKICVDDFLFLSAYDLSDDIQEMRELREAERLGPSTGSIVEEAASRGIPWIRLNKYSLCQLGYGANQKRIQATVTSETSSIGVELACDKEDTKYLLEQAEVEVPRGDIIRRERSLEEACRYVGYPLVIKPVDGNHGRGITVNIQNYEEALVAFHAAKQSSSSGAIIVEKFIT